MPIGTIYDVETGEAVLTEVELPSDEPSQPTSEQVRAALVSLGVSDPQIENLFALATTLSAT